MRNNKICLTCGKTYTYCSSCSQYAHLPLWMTEFHDDNCRQIFNIVSRYAMGKISAGDALEQLKNCDVSGVDNFQNNVSKYLTELWNVTIPANTEVLNNINADDTDTVDTTALEDVTEDGAVVVEKTAKKKKKK